MLDILPFLLSIGLILFIGYLHRLEGRSIRRIDGHLREIDRQRHEAAKRR